MQTISYCKRINCISNLCCYLLLALLLLAANRAYSVGDWCLDGWNLLKSILLQFPILTQLGTHNLCANTQKTNRFQNFAFTIFGEFFKY